MTGRGKEESRLKGFQDLLALSDADRRALIATAKSDVKTANEPRRHARLLMDANVRIALQLEGPTGPGAGYVVYPVDISESGISFIHCAYLHENTRCRIHLRTLDGKSITAPSRIARARYLKGKAHEVAAEFDTHLDPSIFVAPDPVRAEPPPPLDPAAELKDLDVRAMLSTVVEELQAIAHGLETIDSMTIRLRGVISSAQTVLESP